MKIGINLYRLVVDKFRESLGKPHVQRNERDRATPQNLEQGLGAKLGFAAGVDQIRDSDFVQTPRSRIAAAPLPRPVA